MSLKDAPAHRKGKRHQRALSKVDVNPQTGASRSPTVDYGQDVQADGRLSGGVEVNTTVSNPLSSGSRGAVVSATVNAVRQRAQAQKKLKKAKQPKGVEENDSLPAKRAGSWQSIDCGVGYFIDSFPDPLEAFFALYAPFRYNRFASSHDEFKRLCTHFRWPPHYVDRDHPKREEAWQGFRIAMVKTFNTTFGDDEHDFEAWGRMCVLVGMKSVPDDLEARKLAMIKTHVNLCDLLDTTRQNRKVHIFSSLVELRDYTLETGKVFPREEAYAGGLLKYLLREIFGKYHGSRGRRGAK